MGTPLFRKEVLENQAGRFEGAILLIRPVPMQVAACAAALLAAAVLAFLILGHYTRSITVSGQLVPVSGATKATAPQFGRIVAIHAREGEIVAQGQLLFEISSERMTRDGGVEMRTGSALQRQRELAGIEAEAQVLQLNRKRIDLDARAALFRDEARFIEQERSLQGRRLDIAEEMLRRSRELREQGFVSAAQLAQAEGEQIEHQARLQAIERNRLAALREQSQVASEQAHIDRQLDIVRLQGERSQEVLEQGLAEQQARMNVRILAQAAGRLTAVTVHAGDTVEVGASLATIVPQDAAFEAQLAAPSDSIGFAAAGQAVRMRVAAFPYQKFGYLTGRVRVVEHGPLVEVATSEKRGAEPYYRIAVSLDRQFIHADGKARQFKPGMRLEAVIRQDRRRLIQWLFDPVRSGIRSTIS